jgi:hypothetical protein
MAPQKSAKKRRIKSRKVVGKKAAPKRAVAKKTARPRKAPRANQAKIEMEFIGPTEELGKLLFDLFETHELQAGFEKQIAPDAKIELLPSRIAKEPPSAVVLLTIGVDVPQSLASDYLWHRCRAFSNSRNLRILVNQTKYIYNENELKHMIKTTIEKEAAKE